MSCSSCTTGILTPEIKEVIAQSAFVAITTLSASG